MKYFLINYGGTVAVSVLLVVILFFVIRKMIKDRKSGKNGCSCGCENCQYGKNCKK